MKIKVTGHQRTANKSSANEITTAAVFQLFNQIADINIKQNGWQNTTLSHTSKHFTFTAVNRVPSHNWIQLTIPARNNANKTRWQLLSLSLFINLKWSSLSNALLASTAVINILLFLDVKYLTVYWNMNRAGPQPTPFLNPSCNSLLYKMAQTLIISSYLIISII